MTTLNTTLGTRIGLRRMALDLSQKGLAERLGISPQYMNDIEHDRRTPSLLLLKAIAAETKLDLDVLCYAAGMLPPDLPDNVSEQRIIAAFAAMRQALE